MGKIPAGEVWETVSMSPAPKGLLFISRSAEGDDDPVITPVIALVIKRLVSEDGEASREGVEKTCIMDPGCSVIDTDGGTLYYPKPYDPRKGEKYEGWDGCQF